MKIGTLALGLLFIGNAASAQTTTCMNNGPFVNCNGSDGSFTQCNRTGTIVNCNTTGGVAMNPPTYQAPPSGDGGAAAGAALGDLIRSIHTRKVHGRVMKALQAGDCHAALLEATKADDIDYTLKVEQYCTRLAQLNAASPHQP